MRTKLIIFLAACLAVALALPQTAAAQSRAEQQKSTAQSELAAAEAAVVSAEAAGAPTLAKDLYEEAMSRLRTARANWSDDDRKVRENAILRAVEAKHAARAAEAQALLIASNTEIRNLRADIGKLGGSPAVMTLYDPPAMVSRGLTSMDRVIVAENAIKTARGAGASQFAEADLEQAEATLKTARMLAKNNKQSDSADHLAFLAEMMARRAEYIAHRNALGNTLPDLRNERTRLARAAEDNRARQEQERRLSAEREATELRRQLAAQEANRQAEKAELERLRQQVAQTEAQFRSRLDEDRAARIAAEKNYDELRSRYEAALVQGGATGVEIEALRRQVEDQSLALRSIQERERSSEASLNTQIGTLEKALEQERNEGRLTAEVLAQREDEIRRQREELAQLQKDREENERRRLEAESARTAQVAAAETRATQAESELARTREELARRDAAAQERITAMQSELSKLAATRQTERGFIVTLPGLFFDSGKSDLKAGARNTLAKIAEQLRINEGTRVAVEGHTDSVGSDALNQALSEKRAAAVRDYLVSRGIPASRITMTGLGETTPVATNDTAAGRQQNRRVELVISQ